MLTSKDVRLCSDKYFILIQQQTDSIIELQSKNTKHCWVIQKCNGYTMLHHKHKKNDPYYHKHRKVLNVTQAISQIKSHDEYVLNSKISAN